MPRSKKNQSKANPHPETNKVFEYTEDQVKEMNKLELTTALAHHYETDPSAFEHKDLSELVEMAINTANNSQAKEDTMAKVNTDEIFEDQVEVEHAVAEDDEATTEEETADAEAIAKYQADRRSFRRVARQKARKNDWCWAIDDNGDYLFYESEEAREGGADAIESLTFENYLAEREAKAAAKAEADEATGEE